MLLSTTGCTGTRHRCKKNKKRERKTDPKCLIVCFQGNCSNQFSPPGTIMGLNQKKKKGLLQKIQQSILKSDLVSLNATSQLRWRDALSSVGKLLQASSPGKCNIHYFYFPLGTKRSATPFTTFRNSVFKAGVPVALLLLLRMKPKHVSLHP